MFTTLTSFVFVGLVASYEYYVNRYISTLSRVITYMSHVEALETRIKIESGDQSPFSNHWTGKINKINQECIAAN